VLQSFASKRGKLVAQRGQTESERSIGGLLLFVYHCFDRIVNYLSGLSRPEQVEGYFTDGVILGSQGFVESHFLRLKQTLGYRRHNAATHLTALGSPGLWVFRDLQVRPVDQALAGSVCYSQSLPLTRITNRNLR